MSAVAARWWRVTEVRVLREHFPTGGVAACAPLLPGRSRMAIELKARALGIAGPPVPRPAHCGQRIALTPLQEWQLQRLLARPVTWRAICTLAAQWGVSPGMVLGRVRTAGGRLHRARRRWTPAQDAWLRAHCDLPVTRLVAQLRAQGVRRSVHAVYLRLYRMGLAGATDHDGYSAIEASRLCGLSKTFFYRQIHAGSIPGRRRVGINARRPGAKSPWLIAHADLRAYLRAHPDVLARVRRHANRLWLADLLGEVAYRHATPAPRRTDYAGPPEYRLEAA